MDFKDKVAIVTGGGTGIGRATSIKLAKQGVSVVVNFSKSKVDAEETVKIIRENGGSAIAIQADVSMDEEVRKMVEETLKAFGTVNFLVNNASITRQLPINDLESVNDDTWNTLFDINVKGMFNCARAVAPILKKNKQGAIVNLGSIAGLTGLGSSLPYAVSKAAVHGLTKSLAYALAPEIRVNSVAPGAVDTRWWKGNEEKMYALSGNILLKRISTPEDIADIICAILVQDSMTGQIITVDNGQTM
ncbi:SDR family NAD(P)-dependent oxidoreductase [Desnuesiella massiliensis]|uniref:SDR family NAD(P)-dependent oxidoreductase n=1 Tax=Desnuesiella massiliensis TaxID=1650662 RepID=UPI0006E3B3BA|nr:SDR family NAD(P)-dependent oxidoreductase [Desnuesiella massiliensis]